MPLPTAGVVVFHVLVIVLAAVPHAVGQGGLDQEPAQFDGHGAVAGHVFWPSGSSGAGQALPVPCGYFVVYHVLLTLLSPTPHAVGHTVSIHLPSQSTGHVTTDPQFLVSTSPLVYGHDVPPFAASLVTV